MLRVVILIVVLALGAFLASRVVWVGRKQGPTFRQERYNAWHGRAAYKTTQPVDSRKQWRPVERRRRLR